MTTIAEQVITYAIKHYNEEGWDFVYECHTADDIAADLAENNITTFDEAIAHYAEIYGLVNEQREEVKSFSW
jgi:2-polyprenyl-3-methyl-5-hydroxy-6-metoxy-1,4-benzoquinol methylase